ncbi:MAG TPA: hypothetical protein VEG30_11195 [Terriglobales bacterium]|nr:hypothetical protein [Terriglobales bacterium]
MKSAPPVLVCFTVVFLYGALATGQDKPATQGAVRSAEQNDSAPPPTSNAIPGSKAKSGVQRREAPPRTQAIDLLQRSHAIGEQLPLRDRLNTLQRQVRAAARLDPSLARAWANELLEASNDLPDPDERAASQAGVVVNLAPRDVEGALEIFRSLPASTSTKASRDPRTMAAQILFPALLNKDGAAALPTIEKEAVRLGSEDAYPYSAMGQVAVQSGQDPKSAKDDKDLITDAPPPKGANAPDGKPHRSGLPPGASVPRKDPAREATVLRICRQAFSYYESSTRSLAGDLDFADMIMSTWQWLPADFLRSALHTSANNLVASAADSDLEFQNSSDATKDQKVHQNPADLALVQLAPVLSKLDPEALEKVKQARPFVAQSLQPTPPGGVPMWMTGTPARSSGDDAMLNIQRTAQSDPNKALSLSQDLTDPAAKAQALSTVASAFAAVDPQQATRTLEQADKLTATVKDKEEQLHLVISEAEAAAAIKNMVLLRQSMGRAFDLADQITRAEEDARAEQVIGWRPLMRLVNVGMKLEPELTVAYIDHLNTPVAKANLLLAAAESIPLRQDSKQKPNS